MSSATPEIMVQNALQYAFEKHLQPDAVSILRGYEMPVSNETEKQNHNSFFQLALRLLSISANSASCERLFSSFGNILTKHRNRVKSEVLSNLGEIRLNICHEHLENNAKKDIRKRHFGPPTSTLELQDATAAVQRAQNEQLAVITNR